MPGLNWQPLTLRFDGSLETKEDARIGAPPDLDLLRDAHFEEVGGVQTRPPFGSVMGSGAIYGGGSLSNCRKLARVNGELCLFTDTGLYSWNEQQSAWVLRGTHLAVTVAETPRFATAGDQIDGDRAELNGTVIYAWSEGGVVSVAAMDKSTGSVLLAALSMGAGSTRPRLVALATKIMLFLVTGGALIAIALDPASPSTALFSGPQVTILDAFAFNLYFDVVRAGTQDLVIGACRRQDDTINHEVFTVTPALVVTQLTKARACDGPIAVATIPDGTKTQVVRGNGTNVQGDLLTTSSLADVFTGQALGTATVSLNQVTAVFTSTTSCHVFWSRAESETGVDGSTVHNTVSTSNSVGSAATLVRHLGIASRAFTAQSRAFVWLVFSRQNESTGTQVGVTAENSRAALQNAYYLYRDDGLVVARALSAIAGGHAPTTGRLPAVTATSGSGLDFAWCATGRRRIELGGGEGHTGYAARDNVEVSCSFDSNASRRTAVHGRTLYIADSIPLQYDGTGLYETGFLIYPYQFSLAIDDGGGDLVPNGTYTYKSTWRFINAQREGERSTTAFAVTTVISGAAGGAAKVSIQIAPLTVTRKSDTRVSPAAEIWRTKDAGEPFFLASGIDPAVLAGGVNFNGYIPNKVDVNQLPGDLVLFTDNFTDAVLGDKELNPENDTLLEALAPPGARIIVPTDTRLLLAGVPGDPDSWWYSRERAEGEIASFHDSLRVDVPPIGGDITALWADDQFVYVARETAIYAFSGPGFNNSGEGQNYTLVRTISRDVGVVSQEAHAPTPVGRLFKSAKGWYILDGGGGLRYVGGAVADFDTDTVVAVHTITAKHQVRVLTTSRLLIWDYRGLITATSPGPGRWAEWTVTGGLDACLYNGVYTILTAAGPKQESSSYTGLTYGLDAALTWIKPADLMGAVAVRSIQPLGEYRSAFLLRMRIAYNYDETVIDDVIWNPSPTTVGGPLQMIHGPKRRQCEAIKVRLTAVAAGAQASLATASGLSHVVATSGSNWAATFAAKTGNYTVIGELGNGVTMSISFESGTGNTIDVRDHFAYDQATGLWSPDLNNVGVRVVCAAASLTVAALEAAIAAATNLVQVSAADGTPSKTIDGAAMAGLTVAGAFTGGTFTSPTGEALKLSGLALEVGIVRPTYRRLSRAQKA